MDKVATQILRYLGNNAFFQYTGIKLSECTSKCIGIEITLPDNKSKANAVQIEIIDSERQLYSMRFINKTLAKKELFKKQYDYEIVKRISNIFGPDLRQRFEKETGLPTVAPVQQPRQFIIERRLSSYTLGLYSILLNDVIEMNKWYEKVKEPALKAEFLMKHNAAMKIAKTAMQITYVAGGREIEETIKRMEEYWEPRSGNSVGHAPIIQFEKEFKKVTGRELETREVIEEIKKYEK